jgi:hypothetical protein
LPYPAPAGDDAAVDDLPGDPRDHMDALLRFLVPFAQRQIDRAGGFPPFGASMAPDGELKAITVDEGDAQQQLDRMRDDARADAADGILLAVGICCDVNVTTGGFTEAIRVELEHRDAEPVTCVLPYRNTDDELTFGEILAIPGDRRTWPAAST